MRLFKKTIAVKELCLFSHQLGTLMVSGVSIIEALTALSEIKWSAPLSKAILSVKSTINDGGRLSSALNECVGLFPATFVNMIKAGEESGRVGETLLELAGYMDKNIKIRNKIKSAMTYPIIVLVMAVSILMFLMVFIVPKFATIFAELIPNGKLPALTLMVLNLSSVVSHQLPALLCVVVVSVVGYKLLTRIPRVKSLVDRMKLNLPIFGALFHKSMIARFCFTLSSLLKTGVRLLNAIRIVKIISPNKVYQDAIEVLYSGVKEGGEIHESMKRCPEVFDSTLVAMVKVGEKTGKLDNMLRTIGASYENDVDTAASALTSIIEPCLIVFLAFVVGTIVIALFLPLISIIGSLSG